MRSKYHRFVTVSIVSILILLASLLPTNAQDDPVRILFMHHSTGAGLIWGGDVREGFADLGYEFWDHGYNGEGLVDPGGQYLGQNWDVPGDNTDPDGWYHIFNQPVTDPPSNTFSHMLAYDVILFKSCFPASNISSNEQFEEYQRYYLAIRDVIDQHPDKLFIPFTTPPLVPNETDAASAARARRWAEYLTSPEYLAGHPNIAVFDFFDHLADENGYLRAEYRADEWDSHPNDYANQVVGPLLVAFVDEAIQDFVPDEAPEAGEQTDADTSPPEQIPAEDSAGPEVTAHALIDFEGMDTPPGWWDHIYPPVNRFVCQLEATGDDAGQALRLAFDILPEGTAACGFNFVTDASSANSTGIRLRWQADQPGLFLRIGFGIFDPSSEEATPFDTLVATESSQWASLTVHWEDLTKADWYEGGVETFEPAQLVWIAFEVGNWENAQVGSIWIDDIALVIPGE